MTLMESLDHAPAVRAPKSVLGNVESALALVQDGLNLAEHLGLVHEEVSFIDHSLSTTL